MNWRAVYEALEARVELLLARPAVPFNAKIAPHWYISPATGKPGNTGLTASSPLPSARARRLAWGVSPRISQPTIVEWLDGNDVTDPDDYGDIVYENGGSVTVLGQTIVLATGAVSSTSLPIRVTGPTARPWLLSDLSRATGYWTQWVGKQILFNTGARCTIVKDAGNGSVWLSKPQATIAQGDYFHWPHPTADISGATSYSVIDYTRVCVDRTSAVAVADAQPDRRQYLALQHIHRVGGTFPTVTSGGRSSVYIVECISDEFLIVRGCYEDGCVFENVSLFGAAVEGSNTSIFLNATFFDRAQCVGGTASFDGDTILMGPLQVGPYGFGMGWVQYYGPGITVFDNSYVLLGPQFVGGHCLSGYVASGAAIDLAPYAKIKVQGVATVGVTLTGAAGDFTVLGQVAPKMSTYDPTAGTWTAGLDLTWAALEANRSLLRPDLGIVLSRV